MRVDELAQTLADSVAILGAALAPTGVVVVGVRPALCPPAAAATARPGSLLVAGEGRADVGPLVLLDRERVRVKRVGVEVDPAVLLLGVAEGVVLGRAGPGLGLALGRRG